MAKVNMKRFLYITILTSAVVGVLVIVLWITWKMPFNNYKLNVFQRNFNQSIGKFHPLESNLIAEAAEVGNWADGTYCEFLAGQFRFSTLSKEEIEKAYPYNFFPARVYFLDDKEFSGNPWLEWKEKYLKNYKPKKGENVYLVWKSDYDNFTEGDIRCD